MGSAALLIHCYDISHTTLCVLCVCACIVCVCCVCVYVCMWLGCLCVDVIACAGLTANAATIVLRKH